MLQRLGPKAWSDAGLVSDAPLAEALLDGLVRTLDANSLEAGALAERMGGKAGSQHMLRFTLSDPEGGLVGGYTVTLS